MAKRSEALQPLSHDHHAALVVARTLKRAEAIAPAAETFLEFWRREGRLHFQVEEEVLLPGSTLAGPGEDSGVARLLDEHLSIRRQARRVAAGEVTLEDLHGLGEELDRHVRFEERELFPRIEQELDRDALERLGAEIARAEAGH